jgi:hypothetical protein
MNLVGMRWSGVGGLEIVKHFAHALVRVEVEHVVLLRGWGAQAQQGAEYWAEGWSGMRDGGGGMEG